MVKKLVSHRLKSRVEALVGSSSRARDLILLEGEDAPPELDMLRRFCAIDSTTLDVDGVNRMQDDVADHVRKLGFAVTRTPGEARFGDLLVAERPGRTDQWITLVTHVDTVMPNFAEFRFDPVTRRAFGSGVIDNKGGLVVGLSALARLLARRPETELGLRVLCSPNEEMGSIGFTESFRRLGRSTQVAFGLEPALDDGSIIHQRRGNRWYDIEVTGREAHAGRSYGHHANAAHDLAEKIRRLAALTKYPKDLSVAVGALGSGHDKHNVICGRATAKLDVRFPSFAARDRVHRRIERILAQSFDASVDGTYRTRTKYAIVDDCPPFGLTKRSKRLARVYAGLVGRIEDRAVVSRAGGGAGDVNYLSTDDNVVLDGMGPFGGEMHTVHEWLDVGSLTSRARALASVMLHLQTTTY